MSGVNFQKLVPYLKHRVDCLMAPEKSNKGSDLTINYEKRGLTLFSKVKRASHVSKMPLNLEPNIKTWAFLIPDPHKSEMLRQGEWRIGSLAVGKKMWRQWREGQYLECKKGSKNRTQDLSGLQHLNDQPSLILKTWKRKRWKKH